MVYIFHVTRINLLMYFVNRYLFGLFFLPFSVLFPFSYEFLFAFLSFSFFPCFFSIFITYLFACLPKKVGKQLSLSWSGRVLADDGNDVYLLKLLLFSSLTFLYPFFFSSSLLCSSSFIITSYSSFLPYFPLFPSHFPPFYLSCQFSSSTITSPFLFLFFSPPRCLPSCLSVLYFPIHFYAHFLDSFIHSVFFFLYHLSIFVCFPSSFPSFSPLSKASSPVRHFPFQSYPLPFSSFAYPLLSTFQTFIPCSQSLNPPFSSPLAPASVPSVHPFCLHPLHFVSE